MENYQNAIIVFVAISFVLLMIGCSQNLFSSKEQEISETVHQAVIYVIKNTTINDCKFTAYQYVEKAFAEYDVSYLTTKNNDVVEVVFSGFAKTNIDGSAAKLAHLSFLVNIENSTVSIGTASGGLSWDDLFK